MERSGVCLSQGDIFKEGPDQYGMVISHDCDIRCAEEKEPYIEIIPCEKIAELDGNYAKGQNPRCLDLMVPIGENHTPTFFRLHAQKKGKIPKINLLVHGEINKLSSSGLRILQDWLAMRYRRQALPDAFNASFHELMKKKSLTGKFAALQESLHGVWAVIDPIDEELASADGLPYEVVLYYIFNSEVADAKSQVMEFVGKVKQEYEKKQKMPGFMISLTTKVLSDSEFTYYLQRKSVFLNYDYLSTEKPFLSKDRH